MCALGSILYWVRWCVRVYTQAIGDEQDVIDEMIGYFNDPLTDENALGVRVLADAATKASIKAAVDKGIA